MELILNKNNNLWLKLARFGRFNADYLPRSICTLFWSGMWGLAFILTCPLLISLTFIDHSINDKHPKRSYIQFMDNRKMPIFLFWVLDKALIILWFIISLSFANIFFKRMNFWDIPLIHWLWIPFATLVLYSIFALIIMGFGALGIEIYNFCKKKKKREKSVISEYRKTLLNKICILITWK